MSSQFEAAAAWSSNPGNGASPSTSTKLEIYGLYKYVTQSPRPKKGTRPSLLDWTGQAKWDAWDAAGKKFGDNNRAAAETRYIEVAKELGWSGVTANAGASGGQTSHAKSDDEIDLDNLSDDESQTDDHTQRKGTGMGWNVSKISREADDTNIERGDGAHSLHTAAMSNGIGQMKDLLNSGVDLNAKDEYGFTALHLACDRGHVEAVKLLLQEGARTDIKDADGATALDIAKILDNTELIRLLETR